MLYRSSIKGYWVIACHSEGCKNTLTFKQYAGDLTGWTQEKHPRFDIWLDFCPQCSQKRCEEK